MSILQNSNAISAGGAYNITDSLRFRGSQYLTRTPTTTSNRKTWTWSGWVKRGKIGGANYCVVSAGNTSVVTGVTIIQFLSNDTLNFYTHSNQLTTTRVFRDPSAWYHIVWAVDSTQATDSNRSKIYINGEQVTDLTGAYPVLNWESAFNLSGYKQEIGRYSYDNARYFDGYMTEVNFVDGQALTPSDFGSTNTDGVWSPKEYTGTYGTNGFYLPMKETTQATGFNTVLYTGNGGTQSISNVGFSPDLVWLKSRSATGSNVLYDSVRGATNALYSNLTNAEATLTGLSSFNSNGFDLGGSSLNGNGTDYVAWCWDAGSSFNDHAGTFSSAKLTVPASSNFAPGTGDFTVEGWFKPTSITSGGNIIFSQAVSGTNYFVINYGVSGNRVSFYGTSSGGGTPIYSGGNFSLDSWNHFAVVRESGTVTVYLNGKGGTPTSNTTDFSNTTYVPTIGQYTHSTANGMIGDISNFRYVKGTAVYTADFTPPTTALTAISGTELLTLQDSSAIDNSSNSLTVTNSSVTFSEQAITNPVTNTDGTITSSVRANPASGFSVVTYTGTGANATVGHGLSSAPNLMIVKSRTTANNWFVYHHDLGATKYLNLNTTSAEATASTVWNDTTPTSSVFSVGTASINGSGNDVVAYCFSEVAGYSKFGSYTGNGSTSGPTVTTGFRPAFVMFKNASATSNWAMFDVTTNVDEDWDKFLYPNLSNAETSGTPRIQINDTGFQVVDNASAWNGNGNTIIYMAFADTRDYQWNFDASGNKNNWTPNNINSNASSETTYDLMSDTPSLADEDTGNFATLNPLDMGSLYPNVSEANLKFGVSNNSWTAIRATIGVSSGKWYWEITPLTAPSTNWFMNGIKDVTESIPAGTSEYVGKTSGSYAYYGLDGRKFNNATAVSYGAAYGVGDVIGVALDMDAGTLTFYKNNVSQGVAYSGLTGTFAPALSLLGGTGTENTEAVNFGQRPFKYTPPTGYKKLNTYNLPDSSITDGSQYMNPVLYTGNSSTNAITGVGFSPDFTWIKRRSGANAHQLYDTVRGAGYVLKSDSTNAEAVETAFNSFDADGFEVDGGSGSHNLSGESYVAWNWRASDSSAVSNTDGTITSTVSANPTSGFSVVTYTGNGSTNQTVGHGLGQTPKIIIYKDRSAATAWRVIPAFINDGYYLALNDTSAMVTASTSYFGSNTSTTLGISGSNSGIINASGNNLVAYAFADVEGFSKFGSYTGNGSADGPFVYTGFRPAFVMIKNTSAIGFWQMIDNTRDPYNVTDSILYANTNGAEATATARDHLSNGFKIRNTFGSENSSGATYIYMAFAENPFKNSLAR